MNVHSVKLLASVPPSQESVIDTEAVRSFVRSFDEPQKPKVFAENIEFTERTNERTNERTVERPKPTTELQALVWKWRDANHNGTQAQLRRDFTEKKLNISKAYAHECFHNWPGQDEGDDDDGDSDED